jgi:cysteine desulfurase
MSARPIYLDHHATTPVDLRVAEVVVRVMTEHYGNAHSAEHVFGREAAGLVQTAASQVAVLVGAEPEDVRFTSGASEALRLALAYGSGAANNRPLRIAASTIEHPALIAELERGRNLDWFDLRWIPVDGFGLVSIDAVQAVLDGGAELLCLMAANNEVGAIQPIEAAAQRTSAAGAAILVDATQAAGRIQLAAREWGIDYLVVSGHKLYGPKGVGALIGPELGLASPPERYAFHDATPNVPGIAGLGEACRLCSQEMSNDELRISALRDRLQDRLLASLPGAVVNGPATQRLAASLHLSITGVENGAVVAQLAEQVALSTGAACASGTDAPSHVLRAMGLPIWRREGALRISLGRFTTEAQVDQAAVAIVQAIRTVRAYSEAS